MEKETLRGQAEIWKFMFSHVDSMALKSAVKLRIADIIHSHRRPITLRDIISCIGSPSPDSTFLARIMRLLVRRNIFAAYPQSDGGDTLYDLTPSSRWILQDAELSLAPMILCANDERTMAPYHYLSECVREGGNGFEKAHEVDFWAYGSKHPSYSKIFNDGMECSAKIILMAIIEGYKNGFEHLGLLVAVGGGTGAAVAEIVKAHPHIKGINFDLPHVISMAPEYAGVTHVGGDMFDHIPNADAVFIKEYHLYSLEYKPTWYMNCHQRVRKKLYTFKKSMLKRVLHDWSDADCIRILKNCRRSISKESGKVIIVESVLDAEGECMFDDTGVVLDIVMLALTVGGKERTKHEWDNLLNEAGFKRYNIIKIPAVHSIIEAYPE